MLVPTPYWGLFVGTDGGPWHWICEEAMNTYQQRRFALGKDGTLYATDRVGLTVSRDEGCTWTAIAQDIHRFEIPAIVADPITSRVWAAVTDADAGSGTGLWRSDDRGNTWQLAFALKDHYPLGLVVAEDGRALALTSVTPGMPRELMLHLSTDGGASFQSRTLSYSLNGMPALSMVPLWIDPRTPDQVYVATQNSAPNALLRVGLTGVPLEQMRVDTGIRDMKRDVRKDRLLVAISKGLWVAKSGETLQSVSTIAASQCLSIHGDTAYACGWNYAPDQAAIAKLSDDAASFTKVFQYHDTQSPVTCPSDTPVAKICPPVWSMYADQLGIDLSQRDNMNASMGAGCQVASRNAPAYGFSTLMGGLCVLLSLRRRRPLRPRSAVQTR